MELDRRLRHTIPVLGLFFTLGVACTGTTPVWEPLKVADQRVGGVERADGMPWVAHVAASPDRLWLQPHVLDHPRLFARRISDGAIERHLVDENLVAVHATTGGTVWVLTSDPETDDVRLWERAGNEWESVAQWSAGDEVLALADVEGVPLVVTRNTLLRFAGDEVDVLELSEPLPKAPSGRYDAATTAGMVVVVTEEACSIVAVDLESGDLEPQACPMSSSRVPHLLGVANDPNADGCVVMHGIPDNGRPTVWRSCVRGPNAHGGWGTQSIETIAGPWELAGAILEPERVLATLRAASVDEERDLFAVTGDDCRGRGPDPCDDARPFGIHEVTAGPDGVWVLMRHGASLLDRPNTRFDRYPVAGVAVADDGKSLVAAPLPGPRRSRHEKAMARGPLVPDACYRIIGRVETICFDPTRVVVTGNGGVERRASFEPREDGGLDVRLESGIDMILRSWGTSAFLSRGLQGVLLERIEQDAE